MSQGHRGLGPLHERCMYRGATETEEEEEPPSPAPSK